MRHSFKINQTKFIYSIGNVFLFIDDLFLLLKVLKNNFLILNIPSKAYSI